MTITSTPTPYSAVTPGQTIEHEGKLYTVDHADQDGIFTTAAVLVPCAATVNVLTEREIPALGTEREARLSGTVVRFWSGMQLPQEGVLTRRGDLLPGDVVQSSHGYTLALTNVRRNYLEGHIHAAGSGVIRSECYDDDSLIPVVQFTARPDQSLPQAGARPSADTLAEVVREAFTALVESAPESAKRLHAELAGALTARI